MKLLDAQTTIRQVAGKSYDWMYGWGLGEIREAVRTIEARMAATEADKELAESVAAKLARRW